MPWCRPWPGAGLLMLAGAVVGAGPTAMPARAQAVPRVEGRLDAGIDFERQVAPVLERYCVGCHGGEAPKADLSLEFPDRAAVDRKHAEDRGFWPRVADAVRDGEMPPGQKPRPDHAESTALLTWIDRDLMGRDCDRPADPGQVTVRRLNRTEFRNTVRDLLYLPDYEPAVDFPADDRAYGFDNNGDVLTLSPNLVELYLQAVDEALAQAFRNRAARGRLTIAGALLRENFANRQAKVRPVIAAFAARAYRRPVTPAEVDRLMRFAALSFTHDGESFDKATMLPMRAAMMSPEFLFRIERPPEGPSGDRDRVPLDEFALASRLSYFLWSSMPDAELFRLARSGALRSNLAAQVRRMLADPKARGLTESFAGQWLEIRSLETLSRDPALFPDFSPELRRAMKRETELFFEAVVREDLPLRSFLDADFTFLDGTLARHYGIAGVEGDEFRRVALTPESRRGGLLTQASILTATAKPTRTSPVNRGKWILENLYNTPPPPPPPDVPTIEGDGQQLTGTLREIMAKHRADVNCVSCHERMDPLGFALENFDAVGRWRTHDGPDPIDASGTLVGGRSFAGPAEFRALLVEHLPEFRRGLAEKLFLYALGRGLTYDDRCALDAITAATVAEGDTFGALMRALVQSDPFQYRRGRGAADR